LTTIVMGGASLTVCAPPSEKPRGGSRMVSFRTSASTMPGTPTMKKAARQP
jgi:hypothetical protein